MATEGTRDGGSGVNKGQGKYFDREKRPGGGTRFPRPDRPQRGEKPYGERSQNSEHSYGDRTQRGDRPQRSDRPYGDKTARADKPYGDRPQRSERPNRGYGSAPKFPSKDKDDDEEDRGRRSKPSRPKENKPSVAIPDKNKVQMRLEKEQKSVSF